MIHEEIAGAFSLQGRVAVVTGAASGIGGETAIVLAKAGARVVAGDLDEAGLRGTVEAVEAAGSAALARRTNVAVREEVEALAEEALRAFGRIDVWVNSAGVILRKPPLDVTEADFDHQVGVNLKGVYWGCAAAARAMKTQGGGAIVNISSSGADRPAPGTAVYSVTKSGVNSLTRSFALECGEFGVRVNAIGPGFIDTPMTSGAKERDAAAREAFYRGAAQASPLRRIGEPSDIAYAVLYLATDASRFMTGQVLRPNGGATMP